MNRCTQVAAAALLLVPIHVAGADVITIDFEGVGHFTNILNFYNGGTDLQGNSGENFGVRFSGRALGLQDAAALGGTYFDGEPSPSTVMTIDPNLSSAILNYAPGFDTSTLSFHYSSSRFVTIEAYSGLDGTGTLLSSINLVGNHQGDDCSDKTPSDAAYCNFDLVMWPAAGIARSIKFNNLFRNETMFDDVSFNAPCYPLLAVTTQPAGVQGAPAGTANLSIAAGGGGTTPLTYQWRRGTAALVNGPTGTGSIISGATTNALQIENLSPTDAGNYNCVVTNACGQVISLSAMVAVIPPGCPGDADGDGAVGLGDIAILITNWGRTVPPAPGGADLDGSGAIGLGDTAAVIQNWNTTCP